MEITDVRVFPVTEEKLKAFVSIIIDDCFVVSDIKVIEDDMVVAGKNIEVNKPLHYGGYYFYQFSYDDKAGQYTVLSVASDSGLGLVFGGYLFLTVGVFWQLWSRKNLFAQRND